MYHFCGAIKSILSFDKKICVSTLRIPFKTSEKDLMKKIIFICYMFLWSCFLSNASENVLDLVIPSNAALEDARETKLEELQRTKCVIKGDFTNQNLTIFSLDGCIVKSGNFAKAILGVVDPTKTDFYNACLIGAMIDNKVALRDSFPTFNVTGRIDRIEDGNKSIDGLTVPYSEIESYRVRARLDDPIGLFMTAYLYETYGTREQEEEAGSLDLKAARKGLLEAYNNLGWMYENKRGTSDKIEKQRGNTIKKRQLV